MWTAQLVDLDKPSCNPDETNFMCPKVYASTCKYFRILVDKIKLSENKYQKTPVDNESYS